MPSWRTVTFDHVNVAVPAAWPTDPLNSEQYPPSTCDGPAFGSGPVVHTGAGSRTVINSAVSDVTSDQVPADGLWITRGGPSSDETDAGVEQRRLPLAGGTLTFRHDSLDLGDQADHVELCYVDRHRISAFIGLGDNPAVAESIIGSLTTTNEHGPARGTSEP